jgi:hypothetical protein
MSVLPKFQVDDGIVPLPPPDVDGRGHMRELIRLWEGRDPASHKRQIAATVRTAFPQLNDWSQIILTVVRTIIQDMNLGRPPMSADELDEAVFNFLGDICEGLIDEDAISNLVSEIEGKAVEIPALPSPQHPQISQESVTHGHPGALPVAVEIMQDPEWKQIISIWYQPEVENCPGCGTDHKENTLLTGDSRVLSNDKFGRLLGSMAAAHAGGTTNTESARLLALAEVEKNFHEYLSDGMTKQ